MIMLLVILSAFAVCMGLIFAALSKWVFKQDRYMRHGLVGGFATLAIAFGALVFMVRKQEHSRIKEGMAAPEFSVVDMRGETVRLVDFRDRYVLLDFWHTGCGPCRKDTPQLKVLHERHRDELSIIAFSDDYTRDKVREYAEQHDLPWLQVLDRVDNEAAIGELYDVPYYPSYFLVSPQGTVLLAGMGVPDMLLEEGLEARRSWLEKFIRG